MNVPKEPESPNSSRTFSKTKSGQSGTVSNVSGAGRSTGSSGGGGRSGGVVNRVKSIVSRASARVVPLPFKRSPFRSNTAGNTPATPASKETVECKVQNLRHHSDPEINVDTKDLKSAKKEKNKVLQWQRLVQKFKPRQSSSSLPRLSGVQLIPEITSFDPSEDRPWKGQPVQFRAWRSRAPPNVQPFREIDVVKSFWVYCLQLPGIAEVFKDEHQHWCRSNQNARTIFHPQTDSPHIRGGCRGVHHGITTSHGCCTTKSGKLKSANQLYGMLQNDADEYLYSLIDGGLYFVDSRGALPQELLSKHAILADGQETVRCAGELRLEMSENADERVIVLDNRSGTYAPGKHSLELLRTLLLEHFPDALIRIVNVDEDVEGAETLGNRCHRGTTVIRSDVSYSEPSDCNVAATTWDSQAGLGNRIQSMVSNRQSKDSYRGGYVFQEDSIQGGSTVYVKKEEDGHSEQETCDGESRKSELS